jgi:hypothetical protein
MGGFGSGRPSGSGRDKVEECRLLDVIELSRAGCLKPRWSGAWQWIRDGEKVAWINMHVDSDRLRLSYRVRVAGGEWEDVAETVRIVGAPCRFGGARPYFICPGVVNGATCGRRVTKLHLSGRYFRCRHCYSLTYASQSEDALGRSLRRANKIRARLGGDPGMASRFPGRPKGMWARTYEHLRQQALDAEIRASQAIASNTGRLLAGTDKPKEKRSFWR